MSLYVPGSALPAWRAILLVHSEGDLEVEVNGTPAVPFQLNAEGRSESGGHRSEIFLEFVSRRVENWRPDARGCRLFRVPVENLRAGSNMVAIANAKEADRSIQGVNLGLW